MRTLNEVLEEMKRINDNGGCAYFEGVGNGIVVPVVETLVYVGDKEEKINKIKKKK